jgi:hypothetical protein
MFGQPNCFIFAIQNSRTMKYFLSITLLTASMVGYGQAFPYTITPLNQAYTDLNAPIGVTNGEIWDDPENSIPLGFTFSLMGQNMTSIDLIGLGGVVGNISPELVINAIWVYGSDIIDAGMVNMEVSLSPISYQVTGMAPNRIFKLEWKEVAFYNEVMENNTANNRVSFQLWLHETTNVIEFRFGPNTITQPNLIHDFEGKPWCGFIKNFNTNSGVTDGFWLVGGNVTSPVAVTGSIMQDELTGNQLLSGDPANGQVYRFSPTTVHITEPLAEAGIKAYPTEVSDHLFVVLEDGFNSPFIIRNLTGQEVMTGRLVGGLNTLNASALAPGLYLLNTNGNTVKFIKK